MARFYMQKNGTEIICVFDGEHRTANETILRC